MKIRVSIMGNSMVADLPEEKAVNLFRKTVELMSIEGARAILEGKELMENVSEKAPATEYPGVNDMAANTPESRSGPVMAKEEPEIEEAAELLDTDQEEDPEAETENESPPPSTSTEKKKKYGGFLMIRCEKCGNVKTFCTKKPIDHGHCSECEHVTEFTEPLVPLYVNCECGKHFRYMTNRNEPAFDVDCLECGSPVAVQWNEKKKLYETIR